MSKPKILFVLSQKLGWSSYSRLLQQAARSSDNFEPIFRIYNPPKIASLAAKKIHTNKLTRHLGFIDPMQTANLILGRWWRIQGNALRPDAIHTVTQALGTAFTRLAPSTPLSVTIDCTRRAVHADFGVNIFSPADIAREQAVFQIARRIACMTSWTANSVIHDYDIASDKTITLPFPAKSSPAARHPRERNGTAGLPRIGFIGTDFKRKGGPELLAWHQAHFRDRAELHIVSKKAPKIDLPNVIVHGKMPHEWVTSTFLPSMDMFCFPTLQEMAGFVLIEAAAAGVPAITYRSGGTEYLVKNGETGFLVENGDGATFVQNINRLLTDADLRHQMASNALEHARKYFNADKHFDFLFNEILSGIK